MAVDGSFIEEGDSLLLGWNGSKKWSYAEAKAEYESKEEMSEVTEINVHHYGWDGSELVPSWVLDAELKHYLADTQNNACPRELFASL